MVGAHTGCLPKEPLYPGQQRNCWVGAELSQLHLPLPMHNGAAHHPALLMAAAHLQGRCSAEPAPPAQWAGVPSHEHPPSTVDCPPLKGP